MVSIARGVAKAFDVTKASTQQGYSGLFEEVQMRAVVFEKAGRLCIKDLEYPRPQAGEVTVRVAACGLCATDVQYFHGTFLAQFPFVPGHEFAGEVGEIGEGVTELRKGDRVTVDPFISCGSCYFCLSDRPNHCLKMQGLGTTRNGGFAEFVSTPVQSVYRLASHLALEEAALTEPLACVLYGTRRLALRTGSDVLLFGAGPIGLLLLQVLLQSGGTRVVVVDLLTERLEIAKKLGATSVLTNTEDRGKRLKELAPLGFDAVVDATGVPAVAEAAISYVKSTGKLLFFGVNPPDSTIRLSPFEVYRRDIEVLGTFAAPHMFYPAINLLEQGKIKTEPVISHRLQLEDFPKALEMVQSKNQSRKIMFMP
jgi:2-desacetyl-2-hydroxyethyl bacteriochlorophyllide A dehydrogenase